MNDIDSLIMEAKNRLNKGIKGREKELATILLCLSDMGFWAAVEEISDSYIFEFLKKFHKEAINEGEINHDAYVKIKKVVKDTLLKLEDFAEEDSYYVEKVKYLKKKQAKLFRLYLHNKLKGRNESEGVLLRLLKAKGVSISTAVVRAILDKTPFTEAMEEVERHLNDYIKYLETVELLYQL